MNSLPSLAVIRRFTVITAIALLLYTFAKMPVEEMLKIPLIGLDLKVPICWISLGLPILSFLSAFRYLTYTLLDSNTPWKVRKKLRAGEIPYHFFQKGNLSIAEIRQRAMGFFPLLEKKFINVPSGEHGNYNDTIKVSSLPRVIMVDVSQTGRLKKLFWYWYDIEYYFPIGLSVSALIVFLSTHNGWRTCLPAFCNGL